MPEVSDLKIDISEKCDALKKSDNDVKKLNAESISLHKTNSDLCSKIESLRSESNKKDTKVQLFPCSNCNFKSETPALLQQHVLQTHCQNKQSQVDASLPTVISGEPLFEYCCFYCDLKLKSTENLQNHRTECQQCTSVSDLRRDRTTYHEIGTWCNVQGKELFWCEVCPLYYESKIDLDFHRIGFH